LLFVAGARGSQKAPRHSADRRRSGNCVERTRGIHNAVDFTERTAYEFGAFRCSYGRCLWNARRFCCSR
jgi:hypothetical protein